MKKLLLVVFKFFLIISFTSCGIYKYKFIDDKQLIKSNRDIKQIIITSSEEEVVIYPKILETKQIELNKLTDTLIYKFQTNSISFKIDSIYSFTFFPAGDVMQHPILLKYTSDLKFVKETNILPLYE